MVNGLKLVALPVEYVRCAEDRYVLQHLDVGMGHRVLDIGSPKLLSLYLAARVQAEVHATDLLDYFFDRYGTYADTILPRRRDLYRMKAVDGRSLTFPSDSFDRAFAISSVEHIPGDGDSRTLREIGRVLRPGGLACLTVPWSDTGYLEVFKSAGDPKAYWTDAGGASTVFYQRVYDRPSLMSRIVESGPFELVDLSFWGERHVPMEDCLLNPKLPKPVRWALSPAHFPLSRLFLTPIGEDEPSCKKVACLTLQKVGRA
jgi:SAM-dependent methyltransferase